MALVLILIELHIFRINTSKTELTLLEILNSMHYQGCLYVPFHCNNHTFLFISILAHGYSLCDMNIHIIFLKLSFSTITTPYNRYNTDTDLLRAGGLVALDGHVTKHSRRHSSKWLRVCAVCSSCAPDITRFFSFIRDYQPLQMISSLLSRVVM